MKNNSKKSRFIFFITIIIITSLIFSFLLIQNKFLSTFPIIKRNFIEYENLLRLNEEDEPNNEEEEEFDDESFISEVNKICGKASKNLKNYFQTYDESYKDLSGISMKDIDIYPSHIEALLDIIEKDGKLKDNFFKYLKHALTAGFFLILGIISVFAWLCFGFFCCCNCCCCCCCKKTECKNKILFFSLLFDVVIIITCLYGIITCNTMFTAFEDVECSFVKFISEISNGENRQEGIKWIGFKKIISTFNNITSKVEEIKTAKQTELNNVYNNYLQKKSNFKNSLDETYDELLDPDDPFSDIIFPPEMCLHIIQESTINVLDVGAIDILYNYGPVTNDEKFLYELNENYDAKTEKADKYLNSSYKSFTHIFEENSIDIFVEELKNNVKELRSSINKIKDKFVKYIIDYSDIIDNKGNYMVKICYISVICLSLLSGISLVTMYSTVEECCYQKCRFGKGLTKTLSHVSWNLMSIVMILSFFICGVIFLVSSIGKDLVDVISVILGQQNLFSRKPMVISTNSSSYFNVCIHGDGNLPEELGIYSEDFALFELDELNNIINAIDEAKSDLEQTETLINEYKSKIEDRKIFKGVEIYDFNASYWMNMDDMIKAFNELIKTEEGDMWTLGDTCSERGFELIQCPEDESEIIRKDVSEDEIPKYCLNFEEWKDGYKKRYGPPAVLVLDVTYNTVLKAATYYVDIVNNITSHIKNSNMVATLEEKINRVESAYTDSINAELEALDFFNKTIYDMLSIFNNRGDEENSLFAFLRCEFIKDNILITFKYLQKAFGGKVQAFGITFVFASFAMFFSITFTILEIVVINVSLYLQRRRREREEQLKISLGGEKVTTFETTGSEKERIKSRKSKNH